MANDGLTPAGTVTIEPVGAEHRPVVERLGQLERHELSWLTGDLPGPDGLFELPRWSRFFTEDGHAAGLIRLDGAVVGFCLVRPFEGGAAFVHAFFVVRAVRRRGVGLAAAVELMRSRPGGWVIAFHEANEPAARFWRQVVNEVAGDAWTRERRGSAEPGHGFEFLHLDTTVDPRTSE